MLSNIIHSRVFKITVAVVLGVALLITGFLIGRSTHYAVDHQSDIAVATQQHCLSWGIPSSAVTGRAQDFCLQLYWSEDRLRQHPDIQAELEEMKAPATTPDGSHWMTGPGWGDPPSNSPFWKDKALEDPSRTL